LMDVQYMAYWLNGDGTQNLLHSDLPLREVKVTREANGVGRLTASLPPDWGARTGYAGRPLIKEWGTAIYVEVDGDVFDGFIVVETEDNNEKLTIDAVGFIGYGEGQPWPDRTAATQFNKGNVLVSEIISTIWSQVQKYSTSNIGLKTSL